ncbi:MAG TPA: peptidylprolyl isomerase [Dokdonella sp.]|uniref:peptidylprolyl isomerase n=1 Tax=Dokdonella sp. TaxID=2291710 RepID=UPI0025C57CC4|nr:peptidylprolyl isomerase [Dokdonella sp.]MBX3691868.1 peptidylprolyl isomerase [Dokdonella sp.]HNR92136.1 peptidylprolyl isomerase [Dokdonella sp.]
MNKPFVLAVLALSMALPAAHAQLMPSEPLDGIVAVVDEDVILRSELERSVEAIITQYARNPQQLPPRAELERQVLDRLIMVKLQVDRADGTGIKLSDADVDQTITQIARQNRLDVGQLRQAVQQQGLSWEAFRKNVHDETIVQRLRQRVVQSRVQVSDTEIDLMLKNGGVSSLELHLGHILITLPDGATAGQIDVARAKAEDVSRQIAEGLDFTAAAIRYSDAQNALEGGDLGWRSANEVPPAFAEIAERLSPGETAAPVRGPNGFHIIKLVERRSGGQQLVTEYHARHILIKKTELVSNDQARSKIEDIRRRALAGEDFGTLAREYSEDAPTANIGGDMGWFVLNAYGTRVAEALQDNADGQISEPFETDVGWHILQRIATRTEDRTNEAERDKARQTLGARKAEEEYESFLRQMRSEAFIDIRLPGASGAG